MKDKLIFLVKIARVFVVSKVKRESWVSRGVWERRAARRWSRRKLAERSGVAEGTILYIEHGYCMTGIDTLEAVLRELGCELVIKEVDYDF